MVSFSYYESFFRDAHAPRLATVRAGNVIGGGDWSDHRLIPDCLRSLQSGETLKIRYPRSVRPWQFVLDPLNGYLRVAEKMLAGETERFSVWNFAPDDPVFLNVEEVVQIFLTEWGQGHYEVEKNAPLYPEAGLLRLDNSKAKANLGWRPRLDAATTLSWTARWYRDFAHGMAPRELCGKQIQDFEARWTS